MIVTLANGCPVCARRAATDGVLVYCAFCGVFAGLRTKGERPPGLLATAIKKVIG